jgi:fructuronate reductase
MKLTLEGIAKQDDWKKAGIALPDYDVAALAERTKSAPVWVHFGIGNIFRIFLGGIADKLIRDGDLNKGITCVEAFDYDVVDKIYKPYDNLALSVTLNGDGSQDKRVLGSLTEAVEAKTSDREQWERLKEIFATPGLQMISFTITEKGYALKGTDGNYFGFVKADFENGPEKNLNSAMSMIAALLFHRFKAGKYPLALVSMDNVSQNGQKLRTSVLDIANRWMEKGFVPAEYVAYVSDEKTVTFPWTMIDKITPRPSDTVAEALKKAGVEDMDPVITSKKTYIAPFVNAEAPQYLVVEDSFPNGRPPFEKAGVYMTDRDTVNKSERMKVTICLNPLHSAIGPYGVLLNYAYLSDAMKDPELLTLVKRVGFTEGMPVVVDPRILSPKAFIDEVIERFSNPYMPDTPQRLVVDISQGVGIRFGENIKAYVKKDGSAKNLRAIPLALAGWLRYLLAVDDAGKAYELSPDPLNDELTAQLSTIEIGNPASLTGQLKPILSNEIIFGSNLYEDGVGDLIEEMFREEIAGPGAVRATLKKYLD